MGKVTISGTECWIEQGFYPNGNVRLTLQPWAIEFTRPHRPCGYVGETWSVDWRNLSLNKILEKAELISILGPTELLPDGTRVVRVQYPL